MFQTDKKMDSQSYVDNLEKIANDHISNGHYLINIFVEDLTIHEPGDIYKKVYEAFETAISKLAGGLTKSHNIGTYISNNGTFVKENSITYTVCIDTRQIETLRAEIKSLKELLNQECILMTRQLVNKEVI